VSPLFPERAAIVVTRGQIAGAACVGLGGSRRKTAHASFDKHDSLADHFPALFESLGLSKPARLRIALASPWIRLALTPPVTAWLQDHEAIAMARQTFIDSHGEAARLWEVRYQRQGQGEPFLASAIEPAALDAIRQTAGRHGIRHLHVEPLLALAWNRARRVAQGLPWFALAEPGQLTMVHQAQGVWTSLANSATSGKAAEAFTQLLERESARIGETGRKGAGVNLAASLSGLQGWQWVGGQGPDALMAFTGSAA
jgi:hypothetical protein